MNKLFSQENKVPRTLCEAREVAGSAKYKQSKTSMKVCCSLGSVLFFVFFPHILNKEFVNLVGLGLKKNISQ